MSVTGLTQFDETVHLTNIWLKELMDELGWEDRHRAYRALRSTLHVLRDRLPVEAAAHLAAQLPMLVRGFYFEGWRPGGPRGDERTKAEFVDHIKSAFSRGPNVFPEEVENVEEIASAVLRILSKHVSQGEIEDIRGNLPKDIQSLWNASA